MRPIHWVIVAVFGIFAVPALLAFVWGLVAYMFASGHSGDLLAFLLQMAMRGPIH